MPSWPDGVTTTTLLFGKGITIGGNMTSARLAVEPIFQGTDSVVWAADGTPMLPFSESASADDGSYGSIAVPVVDQTGWLDSGQHAYTLWGYKLTETPSYGRSPGKQRVKYWQPLTGQTTVDFDRIPDGSIGLPSSGPIAVVTSVNGQVGAVTVTGGDGAPDSAVAALVNNSSSATRTALAATYETLAGGPKKYSRYGFLSGNFRPKAVYNRLAAIEKGTVTQLRWCLTGTSTSLMKWYEYASDLTRYAGGFAGSILGGSGTNTRSTRSALGLGQTDTGTITNNGNDVSVWPGVTFTLGAGAVRSYVVGGAAFTFDNARLYYIGGTGVIAVQVGAQAPVNIDTSSIPAGSLGIYTATVPTLATQTFTVTQISGEPKIIGAGLWNSQISGIIPVSIPAPGLTYSSLATQAWTNFTAFLADTLPDMITWEAKAGQWTADTVDTTQLTRMLNAIQAGAPRSDVVLIGGPPDSGGSVPGGGSGVNQLDANQLADTVARTYAPTLNVAAWDGYSPLGSWAAVNALDASAVAAGVATAGDWAGDGVHLGWRAQAFLAEQLVRDLGLYRLSRDKIAAKYAVVDQVIFGKNPYNPVAMFQDDQSTDLDLYLYLRRMLRIRATGATSDWMVLDPAQAGQSFLPSDIRLGAANGPKLAAAPTLTILTNQSGAITLDLSTATKFVINMSGNITSFAFSNAGNNGQDIELHFVQDATGGRTIPTSGSGLGGGSIRLRSGFALNTTALGRTVIKFTLVSGGYFQAAAESALAS